MRVNLPVTDVERTLKEGGFIVSKINLKGCFTEEELIGTSHNIVHHPDMPPEAFKDL